MTTLEFVAGQSSAREHLRRSTDRVRAEQLARRVEQLEREIGYRELLLEEVIHRTKNTLQLAVAILQEHADTARDAMARGLLRGVQKQVMTLCRSHSHSFGPTGPASPAFSARFGELCTSIHGSFGARGQNIMLALEIAEIPLQRHQEICLSLIVQELLTNVLKHAFPRGRLGTVKVELGVDARSVCRLVVRDDGIGGSRAFEPSTGLTIVRAFASMLGGMVVISSTVGMAMEVSFPITGAAPSIRL